MHIFFDLFYVAGCINLGTILKEALSSSNASFGRALLGAKRGDIVKVNAPNGVIEFKIVKID